MSRDEVYRQAADMIVDFAFDESVARVFPDMIRRSIPGYETIVTLIGLIAEQYVKNNSNIYDLGCSLGATTLSMRRRIRQSGCRIIAVDNAEAMVDRCKQTIEKETVESDGSPIPVDIVHSNIQDIVIENASMVVLNFTLQFIGPDQRLDQLQRIYDGLNAGGILVISDKILFEDNDNQVLQDNLHLAFKKANGYSDLEISQKRNALENVLIPDSLQTHQQRLRQVGFVCSHIWFQCFNFASIIAFK